MKIWRTAEINVFHRGQSEMICGLTENLKLFREPTEMTYRSTENLKNLGSQLRKQQILEKYQPVFDDFNLFKSPKSLKIPENFKHFNLS